MRKSDDGGFRVSSLRGEKKEQCQFHRCVGGGSLCALVFVCVCAAPSLTCGTSRGETLAD